MSSFAVALVAVGGFVCLYRSQGDPDVATGTRSANASPAALQHAAIVRTRARRSTNGGRIKEAVGGGGGGGGGRAAAALVVLVLLLLIVIVGPITLYMHNIDMPIPSVFAVLLPWFMCRKHRVTCQGFCMCRKHAHLLAAFGRWAKGGVQLGPTEYHEVFLPCRLLATPKPMSKIQHLRKQRSCMKSQQKVVWPHVVTCRLSHMCHANACRTDFTPRVGAR